MLDLGKLTYFFIQGVLVGAGPCLLTCAPLLIPYIAGTQRSWRDGLRTTLVFGLARTAVYVLLGGVVGYIGAWLFQLFYSQFWGRLIWGSVGFLIAAIGLLLIFGQRIDNPICRMMQKGTTRNVVLLGVMLGLAPCLPLIAVLTEIMLIADKLYLGFIYGLAFGLGTIVSPLLLVGAFAPVITTRLFRNERLVTVVCGASLVIFAFFFVLLRVFTTW